MSHVVTGEAVPVDLRLARTASRGLAMALDVVAQGLALAGVILLLVTSGPRGDDALTAAVTLAAVVAVVVGYPVLCEALTRGRTLGKLALGLRVVRDDGGPIRFRHALVRGLAGFFVDFWALGLAGAVAVLVSLCSARGKRVGDLMAGTVVIRERIPRRKRRATVEMPPHLATWAATLNLGLLPDDLALAVWQYLGRRDQLAPAAAENLASRLAFDVSQCTGAQPPAGVSAVDYLAAVLAERRAREQARLTRPAPGHTVAPTAPPVPPTSPAAGPFAPPS
jgi:uncharacterized RDD family membrane protein YckC